jgi:hypothetical protein
VDLHIYDASLDRFINPRVLLPLEHEGPFETLPDLSYRQNGRIVAEGSLTPGQLEIVALPGAWNSGTIPLEISVLASGTVVSSQRFVYDADLSRHLDADGTLVIATFPLRAGENRYEIQTRRYDGTTRLRTYRVQVPPSGP